MFNSKLKTASVPSGDGSIIGAGTIITGDIHSTGDIRIDGTLKGNVSAVARVFVGPEGLVEGNVTGRQADVLGQVAGTIRVSDLLNLRGKAIVDGNIYAGNLQVEPSVTFNGECHMGANVVELKQERNVGTAIANG